MRKRRGKLTPYQKIMRAVRRGTGVRLTWEDTRDLSLDAAIEAVAVQDDEAARVRPP